MQFEIQLCPSSYLLLMSNSPKLLPINVCVLHKVCIFLYRSPLGSRCLNFTLILLLLEACFCNLSWALWFLSEVDVSQAVLDYPKISPPTLHLCPTISPALCCWTPHQHQCNTSMKRCNYSPLYSLLHVCDIQVDLLCSTRLDVIAKDKANGFYLVNLLWGAAGHHDFHDPVSKNQS